jgi:hypothetical protein
VEERKTSFVHILLGGPRGFSSIFSSNFSPHRTEPVSRSYHRGCWVTAADMPLDHIHECDLTESTHQKRDCKFVWVPSSLCSGYLANRQLPDMHQRTDYTKT